MAQNYTKNTLLNFIDENGNKYTFYLVPAHATASRLGGLKLGYTTDRFAGKYKVEFDENNNAYVAIPIPVGGEEDTILVRQGEKVDPKLISAKNIFNHHFASENKPVLVAQNGADGGVDAATMLILDGGSASAK